MEGPRFGGQSDCETHINRIEEINAELLEALKKSTEALKHARHWIKKLEPHFTDNGMYKKTCDNNKQAITNAERG